MGSQRRRAPITDEFDVTIGGGPYRREKVTARLRRGAADVYRLPRVDGKIGGGKSNHEG